MTEYASATAFLLQLMTLTRFFKHYENKFTKTFTPTDILHIFTKF